MNQKEIELTIAKILSKYNVSRVGIFGSFSRNDHIPSSDIDILVSFIDSPSLIQLLQIENEISIAIGFKVDLVTDKSLKNSKLIDSINKDLKIIYHA